MWKRRLRTDEEHETNVRRPSDPGSLPALRTQENPELPLASRISPFVGGLEDKFAATITSQPMTLPSRNASGVVKGGGNALLRGFSSQAIVHAADREPLQEESLQHALEETQLLTFVSRRLDVPGEGIEEFEEDVTESFPPPSYHSKSPMLGSS